jgi:hypothetical protein
VQVCGECAAGSGVGDRLRCLPAVVGAVQGGYGS